MSLALLFSGQGTQHSAMLPWLETDPAASPALANMAATLGENWRARLMDDTWATANHIAQPLITGVCLAAWSALANYLPRPAVMAGYSVGELAAFSAAGLFNVDEAMQLANQRAKLMGDCAAVEPGGLLSVGGVSAAKVEAMGREFGLHIAIRIGVDRCILGGKLTSLEAATTSLIAAGAVVKRLRVHLASHTPTMALASVEFGKVISALPWQGSQTLIVCNVDGVVRRSQALLKDALSQQISHTVEWSRCMATVAERLPRCVLEIGPGNILTKMWSTAFPEIPVRSIDEFQSVRAICDWSHRHL